MSIRLPFQCQHAIAVRANPLGPAVLCGVTKEGDGEGRCFRREGFVAVQAQADKLRLARRRRANQMPEIDKHASRAWRSRLREVLNRDWDPIGVAGDGSVEDEYDGYMGKIAAMLRDNASDEELLAYLKWAEVENMGLGSEEQFNRHRDRILGVIAALRKVGPPP
jgi:hypothetical protein